MTRLHQTWTPTARANSSICSAVLAMAMSTILMTLTLATILLIERLRLPGAGEF